MKYRAWYKPRIFSHLNRWLFHSMYKTFYKISVFVLLMLPAFRQHAQVDLGSWNIINIKYLANDTWSLFGEAQLRSLRFYDHFHYYECKGGVNYKFHKYASASLACGTYQTYREGGNFLLPKNNNEFRIWPQLLLTQSLFMLKLEQRYRVELRFTSNGYRNRFRYRAGLNVPFGKEKQGYKPFQWTLNNEIFFTDREPYFERNRISSAINYKASELITCQIGYLHQFDYKINDEIGRDFLQVGLSIEFSRKKKAVHPHDIELIDN